MEEYEPGIKSALFIKSSTCNNSLYRILSDIHLLKKPLSTLVKSKESIHPFEEHTKLEGLLKSKSAPLFVLAANSKKRPCSLVFGRLYDNSLLDMLELLITSETITPFTSNIGWNVGARPLLIFEGIRWDSGDEVYSKLKSLFVDFWAGVDGEKSELSLQGIQHAIVISADDLTQMLSWKVITLNSTVENPGLSFDFTIGRTYFAKDDLQKKAIEVRERKPKKEKNVTKDPVLGDKYGRVHVPRQDFSNFQVRKVKALKKSNIK